MVILFIILLICLQAIGFASTQSSFALHQNTRGYDVPNVIAGKDQGVNVCIMAAITKDACTYTVP